MKDLIGIMIALNSIPGWAQTVAILVDIWTTRFLFWLGMRMT